jgi:hypothetical protein
MRFLVSSTLGRSPAANPADSLRGRKSVDRCAVAHT